MAQLYDLTYLGGIVFFAKFNMLAKKSAIPCDAIIAC